MIYRAAVFLLAALSLLLQEFIPEVEAGGVRTTLLLVPTVFLCGAATLEYASVIGLAALTGFLWDLRYASTGALLYAGEESVHFASGGSVLGFGGDLFFGSTVLFYALAGTVMFGVSPLARGGRILLPSVMVGVSLLLLQTAEYLALNLFRGGFDLPWESMRRMALCAGAGALAAPFILLGMRLLERGLRGRGELPVLEFER